MRNGRESKRYSSKVDLERITKRTTRTKQPLVLIFMGQSGLGISTLVDMLLLEYENKGLSFFSKPFSFFNSQLFSILLSFFSFSFSFFVKEVRHFSVDANAEEKELVSAEERKAQREGGGLGYREVTAETPSGLKLVVLDFQGLDDPNTRVIAPIVEMIKKRFAGYVMFSLSLSFYDAVVLWCRGLVTWCCSMGLFLSCVLTLLGGEGG